MGLHCWHYFLNIDHVVNDLTLPSVCALLYFLDCDLRWHSSCWQAENSQLSAGVVTGAWEFTFGVRLRCFPEKTCEIGLESWLTNNHSLSCYLVFQLETDLKLQFLYLIVAFWLEPACWCVFCYFRLRVNDSFSELLFRTEGYFSLGMYGNKFSCINVGFITIFLVIICQIRASLDNVNNCKFGTHQHLIYLIRHLHSTHRTMLSLSV